MQFWCNLLPAEHVRLKSIVALRLNRMVSSVLRVCLVFLRVRLVMVPGDFTAKRSQKSGFASCL